MKSRNMWCSHIWIIKSGSRRFCYIVQTTPQDAIL
jgi:hypothetical protein